MKKNHLIDGVTCLICHFGAKLLSAKTRILFVLIAFLLPLTMVASPLQEIRVTIQQKNVPLSRVFKDIETKTDYSFLIRNNDVDTNQKVSIDAVNKTVAEVLGMLFDGKGINYEVNGKRISVYKAVVRQPVGSKRKVSGRITDAAKESIIGASVFVMGTTNGTITDIDGNFSLELPGSDAKLQVSYIGYKTQTISVGNKPSVDIVLMEDSEMLDEVVVVGFGTQKKVNLTGSVAVVTAEDIQQRPVNNLTQALQGMVPGLQITQTNGSLEDAPSINVRGTTTIGQGTSGAPLVLIDGLEGDLNTVSPQDVASISVLKDAAASSIYGSRAPFGVILVTTKSGSKEGKVSVNYNNSFRFGSPINMNHMMNSVDFASWMNDTATNGGGGTYFSADRMKQLVAYRNAKPCGPGQRVTSDGNILYSIADRGDESGLWQDAYAHGVNDEDYFDVIFKKQTFSQEHNFSLSGGSKKLNYYASLNYLNQGGFMNLGEEGMNRYNAMLKVSSELTDWLRFNYSIRFVRKDYKRPAMLTSNLYRDIARQGWPVLPVYDRNGYYYSAPSPILGLAEGGTDKLQDDDVYHQASFVIEPIKNWLTHIDFSYHTYVNDRHWDAQQLYNHDVNGNPVAFEDDSEVHEGLYKNNYYNFSAYTEYTHLFDEVHNFHVMAGF